MNENNTRRLRETEFHEDRTGHSDLLFCTEQAGVDNLMREGVAKEKVILVGNVMIDTLLKNKARADKSGILDECGLEAGNYAVLALHRPSNVDDPKIFERLFCAIEIIQKDFPVLFPIHPRTRNNINSLGFSERLNKAKNIRLIDPVGYLDFLNLMSNCKLVLTDSGGIQEETTILKVPCLTLRENTERPITVEIGSNWLVGTGTDKILAAYQAIKEGKCRVPEVPPLWDGRRQSVSLISCRACCNPGRTASRHKR